MTQDPRAAEYPHTAEPANVGWDMHCHTVYSDGTYGPRYLVRHAKELGLHGAAITDHDTTAGWLEARKAAQEFNFPMVYGSEITADDEGVSVHMLAYQYDPHSPQIVRLFATTRAARLRRTRRMVERIAQDYPITWQDVLDQVKEGDRTTVGRPHIADALVAKGMYATRSLAFAGILSASSAYYMPTPSPDTHEVVEAVRNAGGVSVVAHAGDHSRNRVLLSDRQIRSLAARGLGGLEVWHRSNPPEQRERLLRLADSLDLLVTGGSDWHGEGKPNSIGENLTDDDTVREIIRRGVLDQGMLA